MNNSIEYNILIRLFLLISLFYFVPATAQNQTSKVTGTIYIHTGYICMQEPDGQLFAGIGVQYFYTNNFSIESELSIGANYLHSPLSAVLGVVVYEAFLLNSLISGAKVPQYTVLFFGESFSYHFRIGNQMSLAPYISLPAFDMETPAGIYSEPIYALTSAGGIRLNFFSRKYIAANLFGEYNYDFLTGYIYPEFGLNFGIYLSPKKKKSESNSPEFN